MLCPSLFCSQPYVEGETMIAGAIPDEGAHLVEFIGCDSEPGENECQVQMYADRTVKALFAEDEAAPAFPLTVALEGTGSGTVASDSGLISCSPFCEDEYEAGTKVTLTASPSPGSLFMAWKHC